MQWKSGLIMAGVLAGIACGFPTVMEVPQTLDDAFLKSVKLELDAIDLGHTDGELNIVDSEVAPPIREKRSWTDDGKTVDCSLVYDYVNDPVLLAELNKCYKRQQEVSKRRQQE